ncbi:glycosyltransferase family 2 protein [Selenomonas sp. oral taxon 149]|uniref:glycosyltransferase family 2 protein n=1 Tax=Selenomonas sp. oral taxon 149 TaxID=712535 RepID=UPI0002FF7D06|nr:glycosyltransferase family 2 protein [Selenomonas sp. oral taxon 149]
MDSLYIIIPAYNESETIRQVIDDWYPIIEEHNGGGESRLIIIDDGSKDNTYEIMLECAKDKPLFTPLQKPNSGHGATVLYGYHYALDHGADYVFQTDSDGQTLPSEFAPFWDVRESFDMVIGWRKGREDGLSRIFVTKVLKYVVYLCFGVFVTDANTPYRLMKADTLRRYIDIIPKDYNLSNVILSVIYARRKCAVKYMPITFRPRQGGINSINMKRIFRIGKKALSDFREINRKLR